MTIRKIIGALPYGLLLLLMGGIGWAGNALAHGKAEHGHGHNGDAHMEAMKKTKEAIPEEYRVMDRTPVTPTPASLTKGAALFQANCAACHGAEGKGDGLVGAGLENPPASFLDLEHSDIYPPGEKYWIITRGQPELGMPAFGKQLGPAERWHLVNHILELQKSVRQ
jgi:mono/diheme cytochrome c family protein